MVLPALLLEAPMHPYRMQQMIKDRGQDQLVNVAQRNSVYQALDRLVRDGPARGHRPRGRAPGTHGLRDHRGGRGDAPALADRDAAGPGP